MRIYEGDYAYEIEQMLDPETRVSKGWRVNAASKEEAQRAGKQVIQDVINEEQRTAGSTRRSAA